MTFDGLTIDTEDKPVYVQVCLPVPLYQVFDYAWPKILGQPAPGLRIQVLFRNKQVTGFIIAVTHQTDVPAGKLKSVEERLDEMPAVSVFQQSLFNWLSRYYHFPLGEVYATTLPARLRQKRSLQIEPDWSFSLTEAGLQALPGIKPRAVRQQQLMQRLTDGATVEQLAMLNFNWQPTLKTLIKKGWAQQQAIQTSYPVSSQTAQIASPVILSSAVLPALLAEQEQAISALIKTLGCYQVSLLDGVTGSGKTEVYFQVMQTVIERGQRVLMLVPEIGLAPQQLARLQARFNVPIAVLHSGLSDTARFQIWLKIHQGQYAIVLGTRSSVFVDLPDCGLIIIDEEHDASYKQQDGLQYHARDVAHWIAHQRKIPLLLGSATPSLETLARCEGSAKPLIKQPYQRLLLNRRPDNATMPQLSVVDASSLTHQEILAPALVERMQQYLNQGAQVMLFLNRRGFSPVFWCLECHWKAQCHRCDAYLTYHQTSYSRYESAHRLVCHHCGYQVPRPKVCPQCQSPKVDTVGAGTERVVQALTPHFPDVPVLRIDRDTTQSKGSFERYLGAIQSGQSQILVGTQMLAKGHHFPHLRMVGLLGIDAGWYSHDFHGPEHTAQLIIQVAGRAGRTHAGRTHAGGTYQGQPEDTASVMIQTKEPYQPQLQQLIQQGYRAFADTLLDERYQTGLPPFIHMAIVRLESVQEGQVKQQAQQLKQDMQSGTTGVEGVDLQGPVPAIMYKRQGRYRLQLILQAAHRVNLHRLLSQMRHWLESRSHRQVRWSINVDPTDLF